MSDPVGCTGVVLIPTRGEQGVGEISISINGRREAYLAWSRDPLPQGQPVLVIGTRGIRTLEVEPWEDF